MVYPLSLVILLLTVLNYFTSHALTDCTIFVWRAHINDRRKHVVSLAVVCPNNLLFPSHQLLSPVFYAGWKCCLSWSRQIIIRARGRLFRKAPTRARDSFPNAPTRARDSFPNWCPNSSSRLVFPMFQVELATRFWIASSKCVYLTVSVTVCPSFV